MTVDDAFSVMSLLSRKSRKETAMVTWTKFVGFVSAQLKSYKGQRLN